MLASLKQTENGYMARFERHVMHSVEQVWSMLTDNDKLSSWFSELKIEDLREGGVIKFDMQDGTYEIMDIIELKMYSILDYTWGEDVVRFELAPELEGCRLVLIEKISKLTDHTPKDLAGWHVCLEVIQALLDGRTIESRELEWEGVHGEYVKLVERMKTI
jgi:uncharacterized protein YndB with AHSA1/START domain